VTKDLQEASCAGGKKRKFRRMTPAECFVPVFLWKIETSEVENKNSIVQRQSKVRLTGEASCVVVQALRCSAECKLKAVRVLCVHVCACASEEA